MAGLGTMNLALLSGQCRAVFYASAAFYYKLNLSNNFDWLCFAAVSYSALQQQQTTPSVLIVVATFYHACLCRHRPLWRPVFGGIPLRRCLAILKTHRVECKPCMLQCSDICPTCNAHRAPYAHIAQRSLGAGRPV